MNTSKGGAVWRCGIWVLALTAGLTGCGGGDDQAPTATTASAPAASAPAASAASVSTALTFAGQADKRYGVVKAATGVRVEVFRDASGAAVESLYTNAATGERVRVFNDADGLPQRVVDEASGNALTVTRTGTDRLDYRAYDASARYLGGYAVVTKTDGLYAAPVAGVPSFSGQLSGQLTGATQTGSFALLPAPDAGLGAPVAVSAAALAFADSLPANVRAARAGPQATAAIDRRAILGGLAMGLAVGFGSAAVAPGLIAGAMTAYALQRIGLPVFDGVNQATSIEALSDNLNTFLDDFSRGRSASTSWDDSLAGRVAARVRGAVARAFDAATDSAGAFVDPSTLASLTALPAATSTAVSGYGVDQSGTSYTLSGSVAVDGAVDATATADTGGAGIHMTGTLANGAVTGAINGRLGNGTMSGRATALGQCAALQQSGGQGTFSFAFDAGAIAGTVAFYREAYSIPDGFKVISNGAVLYDTGGLVSGHETRDLTLNGSRVLFVNVNAPNQGTAWQLSVGCPA